MTTPEYRCCKHHFDRYGRRQCANAAKVLVDGKRYCGIHDPAAVEARRKKLVEKRSAKYTAIRAQQDSLAAQQAEHMRRSAAYDDLIAVLKLIAGTSTDATAQQMALAAVAQATGEPA